MHTNFLDQQNARTHPEFNINNFKNRVLKTRKSNLLKIKDLRIRYEEMCYK